MIGYYYYIIEILIIYEVSLNYFPVENITKGVNTKEKKEYTDKELLESLGLSSETQNLLSTLKDIPKSIFKNKPKYDCTQQCIHLRHNF